MVSENYLKKEILSILENKGLEELKEALKPYPPGKRVSFLIGAFLHPKEEVCWKAIYAFGFTVSELAEIDMERARIVIRRLMWMLNEESGGMGWGVGEAFAEALYNSLPLKKEYLQIYVSYIWPEGNYLEYPPAQRGILWGIGRLSQKYLDDLLKISAKDYVIFHLNSKDPLVIFYSLWALSFFKKFINLTSLEDKIKRALSFLEKNLPEHFFFDGKNLKIYTPSDLKALLKD
ncbi:MAG: DVU0298 family protein [Caldimicrobium sp.]